ncbi:MAG: 16S rRNA (cytidine(1402)-2'-O)-methyltransferase [Gammaproteobacteria bacterium]|nr:16S rRNA (cytidine(1402)-2'-O)-methyltransferase [Gammaproteobacteria bacterium]MBT8095142.1 16S rRNA (cytidine(1402)-2'-O)-methyltransferase [Gammaproteobacteria bacterium]MBT8104584.1 16S rRNA (cytidine(1402)-2'-O)-methyltransferase [Gammaproteobacteria bacterium]
MLGLLHHVFPKRVRIPGQMSGTLYVTATPIGNLDDLTPRAAQTLASVDLVAAEDTRHTRRLLSHIGANPTVMALHDHNEERAARKVIAALQGGKDVALVSDAGTPLVSDPGYRLVRAAHEQGLRVVPVPGASAATAALSVCGLPTDRFCFEGFGPAKRAARLAWLEALSHEERTLVLYESVHRVRDCLEDLAQVFGGEREAFVGRELTKLHEQGVRASLDGLLGMIDDGTIVVKGEFVIIVAGAERVDTSLAEADRLLRMLVDKVSAGEAARIAADFTGLKKNELYDRVLEIRKKSPS